MRAIRIMKFAALLLSCMIVTAMTNPLVSAGLVAYWPSEEGSGMVVHDETANNNDGTIRAHHGTLGPNYPADSPSWTDNGKVGHALEFDGDNDYVMVENNSSLNPENITVEAWAYVQENPADEQVLVAKWHADSWNCKGYDLKVEPVDSENFKITWGVAPGAYEWGSWAVYKLPFVARWYHIVGTFDGSELKLYVDNTLRATTTGVPPIVHASENLYMGRESDAAMRWFKGRLDEVRIYRKALTQAEVSSRYAGEEIERKSLVAEWRFEDIDNGIARDEHMWVYSLWVSGRVVYDETPNNNDGTLYSGGPSWVSGKFWDGLRFENTGTAQYVRVPYNDSLNLENFTVEAWVKPTASYPTDGNGWRVFVRQDNTLGGTWDYNWILGYEEWNDLVAFEVKNSTNTIYKVQYPMSLNANTWYHIAGVKENGYLKLYINGELKDTATFSGDWPTPSHIYIGGWSSVSAGNMEGFNGVIDEVRIENRGPTGTENYLAYNDAGLPPDLVWCGCWGDVSSIDTNYTGESPPEGSKCADANKSGTANGWGGWAIEVPTKDLSSYSGGYFKAWVKSPQNIWIGITDTTSDRLKHIGDHGWDGTNTWQLISIPINDFGANLSSIKNVLCTKTDGTSGTFHYYIDHVVWVPSDNSASNEIAGDYENNQELSTDSDTAALWHFNEGGGRILDTSAYNNDGILGPDYPDNYPHLTADGKVGHALEFDGVDDYVMVENSPSLNPENITVEAWAYVQEDPIDEQVLVAKWHADSWNCKGYDLKVEPAAGENFKITWGVAPGAYEWGSWAVYQLPFEARWYHIVGTFDGSELKLYVDNVLRDTESWSGAIVHAPEDLYMGRESDAAMRWFKGQLDEVRIYRKALAQPEVSTRYIGGEVDRENLVAEWKFEGRGRGLSFDGVDDYVEVLDSPSLSPQGGLPELSVETWVHGEQIGLSEEGSLVSKFQWDGSGMDNGWFVKLENKSGEGNQENALDIVVAIAFGTDDYIGATVWDAVPVGEWAHIAFTYKGSDNTLKIYANGAEETVGSWWHTSTGGNVASSAENLFIGCEHGTQKWFKGDVDEVRIYDIALTANEVREHYLEGDLTPPSSSTDPIEPYWQVQTPFTSASFTVTASASDNLSGVASVELWYRYSPDNSTWENWALFGTDNEGSNGWSWSFTAQEGYGFYEFLTLATDWGGNREVKEPEEAEVEHVVAAPIETAFGRPPNTDFTKGHVSMGTGGFVYQSSDISVPGAIPVSFARTYNSRDNYTGPFGRGWTHSYDLRLSFEDSRTVLMNEDGKRDYYLSGTRVLTPLINTYAELENDPNPPTQDEKYILTRPGRMKYYFREDGRLTKMVDRERNIITFGYSVAGLLQNIDDNSDDKFLLEFSYNENSNLAQIHDPRGERYVYYSYDGDGNLSRYTNVLGENTYYNYGDNRLASIVQPRGNTLLTNTYDENGVVVQQVDGVGYTTTFSYSPSQTVVTDVAGNSFIYRYGPFYQTIKEVDPLGYSITYSFDNNGNLTRIVDNAGNQTALTYDENGNLTHVTEKDGGNFTLTYEDRNLTNVADPLSRNTQLAYDSSGRLISLTNPNGNVFQLYYNENGQLENIRDALDNVTTITYEGNVKKVTDPEGHVSVYEYDTDRRPGQLMSYTDPRGYSTSFSYYLDRSIASITNALDSTMRYYYYQNGNLRQVQDFNGVVTKYEYDNMNRLVEVTAASISRTNYEYNYLGLLENVIDNGNRINYEYNARGDMIKGTDQLGRATSFTHEANGNVSSQTDAMGRTTTYAHDAADRVVGVEYPDGSRENFAYNLLGKLTGASRGENSENLEYDNLGRITKFTDPHGRTVFYEYNEVGLLKRVSTAEVNFTFAYDKAYNLVSAEDNEGRLAEYSYDNAGNPENATFSNGVEVDYEWDELNRLTRVTTSRSGENLVSFEYAYDNNGNRIAENRNISGKTENLEYTYNDLNELVEVKLENDSGTWRKTYLYSTLRNRMQMEEEIWEGGAWEVVNGENYSYDASNQLLRISKRDGSFTTFTYDNNGNLFGENRYDNQGILVENRSYFYDFNDRLVRVEISREDNSAQVVEYGYDPLGNRVSRTEYVLAPDRGRENENVLYYLNEVAGPLTQVLGIYNNEGNIVQNFMYGINRVGAFGSENYYFVYDGLGSVWGLVDGNGNLVENYSYDEWGVPRRWPSGVLNTFGFTGEDYDPVTGLVYLRARYYKPDIGRFITADDSPGPMTDPLSWNLYIYCRNNPVTFTDPSGKVVPLLLLILGIFLIGATSGVVYYLATTPMEQWSPWEALKFALVGGGLALVAAGVGYGVAAAIGVTSLKGAVAAGIITGGIMGPASRVVFNLLQGKNWDEGLVEAFILGMAFGGLMGATGFYAAKIPGLRLIGQKPGFELAFRVSYMGPNTYRFIAQQIFGSVLRETVRYESNIIERIYSQRLSLPW